MPEKKCTRESLAPPRRFYEKIVARAKDYLYI